MDNRKNNVNQSAALNNLKEDAIDLQDDLRKVKDSLAQTAAHAKDKAADYLKEAQGRTADLLKDAKQKTNEFLQDAQGKTEDLQQTVIDYVEKYPLRSLGFAVAAGFLAALVLRK